MSGRLLETPPFAVKSWPTAKGRVTCSGTACHVGAVVAVNRRETVLPELLGDAILAATSVSVVQEMEES